MPRTAKGPTNQPPTKKSRTTKSPAPEQRRSLVRARTRASPRSCVTLSALPPELIGTISTFLDLGHDNDLRNLVLAVGRRDDADMIRRAYLWRNFHFLRYSVQFQDDEQHDSSRRRGNFRHWMDVNRDWRDMYHRDNIHLSGDEYEVLVPTTSRGLMMNVGAVRAHGMAVFLGYRRFKSGRKAPCEAAQLVRNVGDVLVAVDGRSAVGRPFKDVIAMLRDGARERKFVSLRFIDATFSTCFCNPAMAIDLGLMEVLRFLVEAKGVNVNDQKMCFALPKRLFPLLAHAMAHPDASMFEYLLSVDGIDCDCYVNSSKTGGFKLLHYAALNDNIEASRLKTLLEQEGVDVHAQDDGGHNALHLAVCGSLDGNSAAKVRILLDAGVNPNTLSNIGLAALDFAEISRENSPSKREIIALLYDVTSHV